MDNGTSRFGDLLSTPLRNGVSYAAKRRGAGVRMINMREIFAYDRIGDQECERAPLTDAERANFMLEPGDLLFARQSLTYEGAGKCVLVLDSIEPKTWESHLIRARPDRHRAVPEYLYYYFRSPSGRRKVETIIQQVAAAGIRGSDLANLEIPTPSLDRQNAIAEVLGALDDKIAANDRVMLVSDQLVRAKYQSLSGGVIPLGRIAINRRQHVAPDEMDGESPYVGLEHIPRRMMWLSDMGVAKEVTSAKSAFAEGDVLFGKLRPYFHKVVRAPFGGICSTDILVVRAKDPKLSGFVLAAASSDDAVRETTAASEGTRMPRTKWADLAAVDVSWPGESAAREFGQFVDKLGLLTGKLAEESRRLAYTRDELLPLLMSGRVRVKDAEKKVEGVL